MPHHGLVAQLGERTVRIRKVEGSIPFESTNKKATLTGGFLIGTVFARRGSKVGTWRQSGGLSQPAWLFRRKAIPFESNKEQPSLCPKVAFALFLWYSDYKGGRDYEDI